MIALFFFSLYYFFEEMLALFVLPHYLSLKKRGFLVALTSFPCDWKGSRDAETATFVGRIKWHKIGAETPCQILGTDVEPPPSPVPAVLSSETLPSAWRKEISRDFTDHEAGTKSRDVSRRIPPFAARYSTTYFPSVPKSPLRSSMTPSRTSSIPDWCDHANVPPSKDKITTSTIPLSVQNQRQYQ